MSDDGVFVSPDNLRTSATSTDSGVSISSVDRIINFSHRMATGSTKSEPVKGDIRLPGSRQSHLIGPD
ncbi:hypothetical protein, partial [Escherichia coli]|uniref:hypothetical protein n=1 Tax=Escherichia coli TaxID=562 RepID=UPI001AA1554D